ncbi:MAG: prolyl oligopeptidase family serine peptidase [Chloroflexaceae bacterium]|jgi:pimeloyl-ACP methyl ester carboxylesterase|nr:prolyl oligopeptidase family serine peptidase [Chloroflexaceae bacterium]
MIRVESLLAARLFLSPQLVEGRLYFISNMSGRLSLYAMEAVGSVPEPLLPPQLALQNPDLLGGVAFHVFPKLGKILLLLDNDGDENYQPMWLPLEGGYPAPVFGDALSGYRVSVSLYDDERNIIYMTAESRSEALNIVYRGELATGRLTELRRGSWGAGAAGYNADHTRAIVLEGYTFGDETMYEVIADGTSVLLGTPLEQREPGVAVPLTGVGPCNYTAGDRGLLFTTVLFDDAYGLGYMELGVGAAPQPVSILGATHSGSGELNKLEHMYGERYMVGYNIDGCSWLYEGRFDEASRTMHLERAICGTGALAGGVLESVSYDQGSDRFALSFSAATSPTQLYLTDGPERQTVAVTRERVLGIRPELLSPGEDASFSSFDGMRVSARLYLPAAELGFRGPRPLVYYVHGGPQSQERPDFAWFSMPLIQLLTLHGFAVFVPNARGSTGYGISYMKRVDRDWGGQDRLDHVHAMGLLRNDPRVDATRAGVVGRSYGGYMTLTLAARHPELWRAAVDMFGPYNLLTFIERLPETWKPYFSIAVGDPERDRDFLVERSPSSYISQIACPLLVIQGGNDPRVTERESRDVVEQLQAAGKEAEFLLFENEGHDILKYENKVACYNGIVRFFEQHLG